MKMVKSLLLGSAAGLVAVTAGQAADLPVKARPVQYVKVCSLYGAGFYYMPGTDMCIKIGGWVRAELTDGTNGTSTTGSSAPTTTTAPPTTCGRGNAATSRPMLASRPPMAWPAATSLSASARNNTGNESAARREQTRTAPSSSGQAFTAGCRCRSIDFYPAAALLYRAGNIPNEDTGDAGAWVWGYTAQFGGGFSAYVVGGRRRASSDPRL